MYRDCKKTLTELRASEKPNEERINDAEWSDRVLKFGIVGLGALFVLFGFWSMVRIVPANSVGIPTTFGSIGQPMGSGFHFTAPWTKVHKFSTRIQESSMLSSGEGEKGRADSISVRGSDGYEMWVDVTIRYKIDENVADQLFRRVGSMDGIKDRLVRPEVRESVRIVFADHTAEEGYSIGRAQIANDFNDDLRTRLQKYGIDLDSAVIRSVDPEQSLSGAIADRSAARERTLQAKIEQEKQVTEAETRKQVAERDATAKVTAAQGDADARRIAAQGESDANAKVSASLTPQILQQDYIDALREAGAIYVPSTGEILLSVPQVPVQ